MIELLRGRLRNIAIDGCVSCSLSCAIGLHDLTGNFLLPSQNHRGCPVLSIDNGEETSFDRCHNDGSELRPIEVFRDLIYVGGSAPPDFTLVRYVDDKLVGLSPFQKG